MPSLSFSVKIRPYLPYFQVLMKRADQQGRASTPLQSTPLFSPVGKILFDIIE
jgi:hypothetical protein